MTGAALPTVSIIIPAYQASAYIRDALESVFAQSYRGFEVIVVNDGSPDTPELECALSPYRDRIVYHRQPNRGPSAARNTGIGLARGEFIAFLDSDDQWLPDFLSSQLAYLQADPSLDLVYADATLVGHVMGPVRTFMGKYPSVGSVTVESLLRGTCIVLTSSVVARRASLVSAGLFDESLCGPEDLELWLRLLHRGGNIAYQERILGLYRLHPSSLTSQHGDYLRSLIEALGKIHREHPLSSALRAIVRARIAAFQAELSLIEGKEKLVAGEYSEALKDFEHAAVHFKSLKLRGARLLLRWSPGVLRRVYLLRTRAVEISRRPRFWGA